MKLRGRLVVTGRRLAKPLRRRVPFDALHAVHRGFHRFDPSRWTDADPFKVVDVDPGRITESILETVPKHPQWGRRQGGSWDRHCEPFADRPVAIAIEQHLEDGVPLADTPLKQAFQEQLERFGNAWGHTSMADFDQRCREIERLCESVRTGYRRQSELPGGVAVLDEINVDIGRDGALLWRGYGQHRLAIAKTLGIDRVPVFIHRRHREWGRTRRAVKNDPAAASEALRSHPDLRTELCE